MFSRGFNKAICLIYRWQSYRQFLQLYVQASANSISSQTNRHVCTYHNNWLWQKKKEAICLALGFAEVAVGWPRYGVQLDKAPLPAQLCSVIPPPPTSPRPLLTTFCCQLSPTNLCSGRCLRFSDWLALAAMPPTCTWRLPECFVSMQDLSHVQFAQREISGN